MASRLTTLLQKVGRRRDNTVVKAAVRAARALVDSYDGKATTLSSIAHSGEADVLRALGPALDVVFDVGANVGEWTRAALDGGAKSVHAFEISPTTADELERRYADDRRVTVNRFGLSDEAGTVALRHFPEFPKLSTTTDYPWEVESTTIEVPVRVGDDYLKETGIDRIDYLKVDVEGADEQVLRGFRDAFTRGAIGAVQFEYTRMAIVTKYLLRDFYEDMTRYGFLVGRIHRRSVAFGPYDMGMETFVDSNWLAVHESRTELLTRLTATGR